MTDEPPIIAADRSRVLEVLADAYREVKGSSRPLEGQLLLFEDLDVDSLDAIEMVAFVEERLGTPVLDAVGAGMDSLATVDDLVGILVEVIGPKG